MTPVMAAFFLSGAATFALEALWFRSLELSVGASAYATMALFSGYMLGLSAGSLAAPRFLGRRTPSPGRLLGFLHVGFALSGAVLLAAPGLPVLSRVVHPALRLAAGIALVAPTGAIAGAAFPSVSALAGGARVSLVPILYGANILGGVVGLASVSFLGLEFLGRRGCTWATVALCVALAAWFPGPGARAAGSPAAAPAPSTGPSTPRNSAGLESAVLGFLGLGMETVVVRLLTPVMGVSVYALAATLLPFLAGLGLGPMLVRRAGRSPESLARLALLASLFWGLPALAFPRLPHLVLAAAQALSPDGVSWGALLAAQVLGAVLLILPAATLTGALFTAVLSREAAGGAPVAAVAASLAAANALGAALGPIAAGLLLVPAIGVQGSYRLIAGGYGVFGLLSLGGRWREVGILGALLAAAAGLILVAAPVADPLTQHAGVYWAARRLVAGAGGRAALWSPGGGGGRGEARELIEGPTASVLVVENGRQRYLTVDGKPASNTLLDSPTQSALARVPLALVPRARSVLVIGWGSGHTVAEILATPVERVVCVEISPEVIAAAPWFSEVNARALTDPRLSLVVDDGRNYLAAARERFDLIVSQPSNPWVGHSGALFTREFFALCRSRLREGGRLLQWFQTYGLGREELQVFLGTFAAVFPGWTAWQPQPGDLLVASGEVSAAAADRVRSATGLAPAAEHRTFPLAPGLPLNTDDRPILSFRLARLLLEHGEAGLEQGTGGRE